MMIHDPCMDVFFFPVASIPLHPGPMKSADVRERSRETLGDVLLSLFWTSTTRCIKKTVVSSWFLPPLMVPSAEKKGKSANPQEKNIKTTPTHSMKRRSWTMGHNALFVLSVCRTWTPLGATASPTTWSSGSWRLGHRSAMAETETIPMGHIYYVSSKNAPFVAMPGAPFVASLLLVVRPGAPSC